MLIDESCRRNESRTYPPLSKSGLGAIRLYLYLLFIHTVPGGQVNDFLILLIKIRRKKNPVFFFFFFFFAVLFSVSNCCKDIHQTAETVHWVVRFTCVLAVRVTRYTRAWSGHNVQLASLGPALPRWLQNHVKSCD